MAWFWSSKKEEDDDEYEYYTDSEEEEEGEYEDEEEYEEEEEHVSNVKEGTPVGNEDDSDGEDIVDQLLDKALATKSSTEATLVQKVENGHSQAKSDQSDTEPSNGANNDDDSQGSLDEVNEMVAVNDNDDDDVITAKVSNATADDTAENSSSRGTKSADREEEKKDQGPTTIGEKQSLLALAAEHDRVDILQAILTPEETEKEILLTRGIPPLHLAVSYGSVSAVNCFLRMGANPAIRPAVTIENLQLLEHVQVSDPHRFNDLSAWEVAFGKGNVATKFKIPPSKREAIRHAFTNEALRAVGSDEADRLQELLEAGMPAGVDIGGKDLYEWSVEMSALRCEELLRPNEAEKYEKVPTKSAVLDRPNTKNHDGNNAEAEPISLLYNRLDELESLAKALSTCLDNLAEEVSVCHGLLLMGGGAAALSSHVRSLKAQKDGKLDELDRLHDSWENSQDELAYWIRECGKEGLRIVNAFTAAAPSSGNSNRLSDQADSAEVAAERQKLIVQIASTESKVQQLRVSIADLSEECDRDLEAVNKKGLQGGIALVRNLREEIRELDYEISEMKSAEAVCSTKISLLQGRSIEIRQAKLNAQKIKTNDMKLHQSNSADSNNDGIVSTLEQLDETASMSTVAQSEVADDDDDVAESEKLASGQSTAIAIRNQGNRGFFPITLWQILLRIIGFKDTTTTTTVKETDSPPASSHNNVMVL